MSSSSFTLSAETRTRTYTVLYYKRPHGRQHLRGVPKFDGTLALSAGGQGGASSSVVVLRDENDNIVKSLNSKIALSLEEIDEGENTTKVGPWEVEIVEELSTATAITGAGVPSRKGKATPQAPMRKVLTNLAPFKNRRPPPQPIKNVKAPAIVTPALDHRPAMRPIVLKRGFQKDGGPAQKLVRSVVPRRTILGKSLPSLSPSSAATPAQDPPGPKKMRRTSINQIRPAAGGPVPSSATLHSSLKPHQRSGHSFLLSAFSRHGGAILADEMGLGKTALTVAIIHQLFRDERGGRFVVVCPSSLIRNWSAEFDKWLGRAGEPRRIVVSSGAEEKIKVFAAPKRVSEVLILSYEMATRHAEALCSTSNVSLLVVDEGHRLKASSKGGGKTVRALDGIGGKETRRLLISGTPVQNDLKEFWALSEFICKGIFGTLAEFCRIYERPIAAANVRNAHPALVAAATEATRLLETVTASFMLRRTQKEVLKMVLPPRTEYLIFCAPTPRQRSLYNTIANGTGDTLCRLTSIRKLCSHPRLLETIEDPSNRTDGCDDISICGKLVVFLSLLAHLRSSCSGEKVVVSSNFTSVLDILARHLEMRGWTFQRLDGSTCSEKRQEMVDVFNRTSAEQNFCFLLSARAGGCGLNLVGASRLIMYDPDWNPATDLQTMARIYRTGQTKPTTIYRLFTTGTVEEIVYQRQIQKGNLASAVSEKTVASTNGGSGNGGRSSSSFTAEEIKDCFDLKDEDVKSDTQRKLGWGDYDGADTLIAEGCADASLLALAEENPNDVTYIYKNDAGRDGKDECAVLKKELILDTSEDNKLIRAKKRRKVVNARSEQKRGSKADACSSEEEEFLEEEEENSEPEESEVDFTSSEEEEEFDDSD